MRHITTGLTLPALARGLFICALAGCTVGAVGDPDERAAASDHGDDGRLDGAVASASKQAGVDHFIHIGGICSTGFVHGGKKGGGALAQWPDVHSVDAQIDQRDSMSVAVVDLRAVLDDDCVGQDWCYLYAYSNGAAVVSKTLSVYDASRWNIVWAFAAAGNAGGSELSDSLAADLGGRLGFSCELARAIGPSQHRPGWNHNDTGGHTIYHIGGRHEWWYTGGFPDFFSGMANDGAVAYHSSGGLRHAYFVSDDDPWLCHQPSYHYDNHEVAFSCEGYDVDHYAMKMRGIAELGGMM